MDQRWRPASGVVGWLNRKMFEETGDEVKSQGWTPFILDTNGNGKRDEYVEPDQPVEPTKDKRVVAALYGVAVNPADGSVWGTSLGSPRLRRARQPRDESDAHRAHRNLRAAVAGLRAARRRPRSQRRILGVAGERPSRQLRSQQVQGPAQRAERATGKHCPEGWTLYRLPGPQFKDVQDDRAAPSRATTPGSISSTRSGSGRNVPIATGNLNDALLALVDGKFVTLRVPYPIGFFTKMGRRAHRRSECRLEGQGLWTTYSHRTMFHLEGGKENRPKVVQFQLRPDPLAR